MCCNNFQTNLYRELHPHNELVLLRLELAPHRVLLRHLRLPLLEHIAEQQRAVKGLDAVSVGEQQLVGAGHGLRQQLLLCGSSLRVLLERRKATQH